MLMSRCDEGVILLVAHRRTAGAAAQAQSNHRRLGQEVRPVFTTLTDDLLDLTASEKGVGSARYAQVDEPGCSCGGCSCFILCCYLCGLCW